MAHKNKDPEKPEQIDLMLEEITGYVHAAIARLARMEKPCLSHGTSHR